MPVLLILHPAKVATPELAASGLVVQVRAPPPGLAPMARVTLALEVVTVLPPASWTLTTGWTGNTPPEAAPLGCVVKASLLAGPTVRLNALLVADVSEPSVATRV